MKTKLLNLLHINLLLAICASLMVGCAGSGSRDLTPAIQPLTNSAVSAALMAVPEKDRAKIAGYVWAAGALLYASDFSNQPVTVEEITAIINSVATDADAVQVNLIANAVAGVAAVAIAQQSPDQQWLPTWVYELAAGAEDAAALYVPAK